MQFQVPQFIDIAPKVIGPLTIKQFLFVLGGAVPTIIFFFLLQFWLWIILATIFLGAAVALGFFKFNGQPLPRVMVAAANYFWNPRFYLWRRLEAAGKAPLVPKLPGRGGFSPLEDLLLKITTTTHPIEKREGPADFFEAVKNGGRFRESLETVRRASGEREVVRRIDYR